MSCGNEPSGARRPGDGFALAINDLRYMHEISRLAAAARYVTSVCTGSLILGAAGLLVGKRAACHWAFRDLLAMLGATPDPARGVRNGATIAGGGVTAGIDFALVVIAELAGQDVAEAVQLSLEYAPEPPFSSGRPEETSAEIYDAVAARIAGAMPVRKAALESAVVRLRQGGDGGPPYHVMSAPWSMSSRPQCYPPRTATKRRRRMAVRLGAILSNR